MTITLDKFFGINSLIKIFELQEKLVEKHFSLKDTGLTQIVIHNWDGHGLLLSDRENKEKWRKYDIVEFIWLKVLKELRDTGVSLPVLQKYREGLFSGPSLQWMGEYMEHNAELLEITPIKDHRDEVLKILKEKRHDEFSKEAGITWFHLLLMETIVNKIPLGIAFFNDGYWLPRNPAGHEDYSPDQTERLAFNTYVYVSLAGIVREFLYDASFEVLPKLNLLEKNELKLLEIIHSGDYESVIINFKNRKMKSLLLVKNQDVRRKVVDVLRDNAYQDIVIKTHEGMITKIQNTVKMMLE